METREADSNGAKILSTLRKYLASVFSLTDRKFHYWKLAPDSLFLEEGKGCFTNLTEWLYVFVCMCVYIHSCTDVI